MTITTYQLTAAIFYSSMLSVLATHSFASTNIQSCDIDAYLIDPDPRGSNIRMAPSAQSKIIKTITSAYGSDYTLNIHITGYFSGWFLIDEATEGASENNEYRFQGKGWIHSSLIGSDGVGGGTPLFLSPTKNSKRIGMIHVEDRATLRSCKGKWVEVQNDKNKQIGWAAPDTLCTNGFTNCS